MKNKKENELSDTDILSVYKKYYFTSNRWILSEPLALKILTGVFKGERAVFIRELGILNIKFPNLGRSKTFSIRARKLFSYEKRVLIFFF